MARRGDAGRGGHRFQGRREELALFHTALSGDDGLRVLHIRGPGGIGKTELLKEMVRRAVETGAAVALLDGRDLLPTRRAVREALNEAVEVAQADVPFVLAFDEIDEVLPMVHHLPALLEELPHDVVTVLAGRKVLPVAARAAPEWAGRFRSRQLPPLSVEESTRVLEGRAVPTSLHEPILARSHGHPLALVLYAELAQQLGVERAAQWNPADLVDDPALIRELLAHLLRTVPEVLQRHALEVAAFLPVVTEPGLRRLVDVERGAELFDWMRQLSFTEIRGGGLVLHALAREALIADLRWRDPGRCWSVMREVAEFHLDQADEHPPKQWAAGVGMILARTGGLSDALDPNFVAAGEVEPASEVDWPDIRAMVNGHEGERSVALVEHWHARGVPIFVVRDPEGEVLGFAMELRLDRLTREEARADPGVDPVWQAVQSWQLERPRPVLYYRFWMVRDTYQDHSAGQTVLYHLFSLRLLSTRDVAAGISVHRDPERLGEGMLGAANDIMEGAEFEIDGQRFGCQIADTRERNAVQWLRDTVAVALGPMPLSDVPAVPLSEEHFGVAVRDALRELRDPTRLARSLLCRCRFVLPRAGLVPAPETRARALADILREHITALREAPETAELGEVLERTYVGAPLKQLAVADELAMSFSTYRRRLGRATKLLTRRLWALEHDG